MSINAVAPLAGAWIEMCNHSEEGRKYLVAPLAGAWIEILWGMQFSTEHFVSLPSRERGLKLQFSLTHSHGIRRRSPRGSVD